MTTFEVPQIPTNPTNDPRPQYPSPDRKIGDTPTPREVTASKKVDDLSRHESKHSLDPKKDPKHSPQEKMTEPPKPGCCDPAPGAPKK